MISRTVAACAAAALVAACGGRVEPGAGDGGGGDSGSAADGAAEADWTPCSAPGGDAVCGGPNHCSPQCATCGPSLADDELRECYSHERTGPVDGYQCSDGYLTVAYGASVSPTATDMFAYDCVSEDIAKLYASNGRPDLVRYSDRGTYAGAPIPPPPTSCPKIFGLQLCGGACGDCPDPTTQVCMGRSPLHPYSLCVPIQKDLQCKKGPSGSCPNGGGCFTFVDDTASQPMADYSSFCVGATLCAAAKDYPGGAVCTPGDMP